MTSVIRCDVGCFMSLQRMTFKEIGAQKMQKNYGFEKFI